MALELDDGESTTIDVPLALPTADERGMFDVLRAKLDGRTFDCAITGIRLQALRLEEAGESTTFFTIDDIDAQNLAVALARLDVILGKPAQRAHVASAHPLERRFSYEPFALSSVRPAHSSQPPHAQAIVPQLRLLPLREVMVRTRNGVPYTVGSPPASVLDLTGPRRVSDGWFADATLRDEYDMLLEDGVLYRIYHQQQRWFVRGVYD